MANDDIVQRVRDRMPSCAKVGVFDMDGIFRGKYLNADKLASALGKGFGFCDVVLGWDSSDQLVDNLSFTGWHTAYPDAEARLLPETERAMPFEGGMPLILGEFTGRAEAICPRSLLRRVLARAAESGFAFKAAAEFEFFLFEETPQSVRDKGYRGLKSITPGNFGYSMLRSGVHADFYHQLWSTCDEMRIALEGLHTETGPGVIEAAIRVDDALEAADKAALFKTIAKILAQRRGWMATFMAKWSKDWPGQSGHLHMSLLDAKTGQGLFYEEGKALAMSDAMRWFVGGQQALMPELLAMISPTVNSYTRMIPGFWAPTSATWGYENRTCALRVIGGSEKTQRVECRVGAADINPYIALAAAIGSGLWGMENRIEPDAPIEGNAYAVETAPERALPSTLWEAAQRLKASQAARDLFGAEFVDHYAATREWEEREARKAITDWQLARYFEII
ncbi:MAG: glutamine synthetase [Alphaproteobacteria bacterium]|nr:glutamine synthetase [Alphaproteobacteria bacterium]